MEPVTKFLRKAIKWGMPKGCFGHCQTSESEILCEEG